jgi:hypothetical protein
MSNPTLIPFEGGKLFNGRVSDLGLYVWDHKAYYPGARELRLRRLPGHRDSAVSKQVDVFASALFHQMQVEQLNDLDLSYTPPLSSPWDPFNSQRKHGTKSTTRSSPISRFAFELSARYREEHVYRQGAVDHGSRSRRVSMSRRDVMAGRSGLRLCGLAIRDMLVIILQRRPVNNGAAAQCVSELTFNDLV